MQGEHISHKMPGMLFPESIVFGRQQTIVECVPQVSDPRIVEAVIDTGFHAGPIMDRH